MKSNALLAAGLTSLMWGLTGIFVRLLPPLSALPVTAGRLLVALVVVLPVLGLLRSSRRSFKSALGCPVAYVLALLLTGYYLLATAAFQMAPVAEVALLLSSPPFFVLIFRRVRGAIPDRAEIAGAVLAVAGITLILGSKMSFTGELPVHHLTGKLLAICAAGLAAFYAYMYRILAERGSAPETMGVAFLTFGLGGFILVLILGLVPTPSGWGALNGDALLVFLGLGVLSTAIPTIGFAVASRHLPAIVTAMISLFIPLFAGIFAFLVLGERLTPMFIPGGMLVLGGVAMILRQDRDKAND
ncbi:hypothetical protein TPL01_08470 [Sulfuriferula plumbiphila]|uniref:EamA domain-containing protein n=1 Tax=Sulfuriferula plumbiphila TaxID=171865 RepID=A0A512L5F8_9PROT|nr:DMT family transporter [Sulfuriferula plumbiphila]BBP03520.1 hypothetical protein SFPGR_09420 [Sulfuriferula plumbiphila]GEP29709.1 hypothetical protein TPL01_08470 [Sulfuriferula plumbiphila]